MNKREKELQQVLLNNEKEVLKKLEQNYKEALLEINAKIELLLARQDADMAHVIYQVEHQKALKTQVQAILENLQANEFETVSEYLAESYENGFIGTMYDINGQGIPLIVPIDQKQVAEAIQHETKLSESLYTSMGKDVKELQKKIAGEISRGISTGQGYAEIARNLAFFAKVPLNRAMTIARTESHRIGCKASLDAQHKAKSKGADVVKQWDSTLDGDTRRSHRELDGQIREVDKPFEVNGHKAMYPGGFGRPEEDCNCRCSILQRAKWNLGEEELNTLKERAAFFELDKTKDFEDFKKKYMKAVANTDRSSKITDTDKKAIFDYMSSKSYVVNEKLRTGGKLTESEQEFVDNLGNALDKMPTYEGNLQRSLYFSDEEAVKEFMTGYKIGEPVVYGEFLSTTKGETYNPEGQVQIFIQDAKNGCDISSINEGEQEVLYKNGSAFEVINIVEDSGIYYILLGEKE